MINLLLDERLEKDLVSNLMAYLLLKCVDVHNGKSYGYQMKQYIESLIHKKVAEGTLYPLLSKLADKSKYGYLDSFMEEKSKRPRRYYRLTEEGHKQLIAWPESWFKLKNKVDEIISNSNNVTSRNESKGGG